MKRREFLKAAGVGTAPPTAVAMPAIAQSMPELKWRLTSSFPKSLDTIYGGAEVFAKAVAEATDNKFQIQVFAAGEIVPGLAAADAVQNGTVEMCHTCVLLLFRQGPDLRVRHVGAVRPQQPHEQCVADDRRRRRSAQRVLQEIQHLRHRRPATPAVRWAAGSARRSRQSTISRASRLRIGGFAGTVLQKLGVVPQQIAGGDIYPALEKGTIDARRMGRSLR